MSENDLFNSSSILIGDPTLKTVVYFLHVCLLPVVIVFGVIGNIANLYIFTRPSLYRSCSIYFIAGAINGLLLLLFGTTSRWLARSFQNLDATQFSPFFCRFRAYMINIIYELAPYFIACVSIDRYCSSSLNAKVRRLSARPRLAYLVIFIIVLTTCLVFIHTPLNYTIIDSSCRPLAGFYLQFYSLFVAVYYFIALILILISGLGTTYNVRVQRKRIQPMTVGANRIDRKRQRSDGQLLLILLVHVTFYACLAMPFHILSIIAAIQPKFSINSNFLFIQDVTVITLNISQAIDCYVYMLTADLYRKELLILIQKIFKRPQIHPIQISNSMELFARQ
ncbi:hypothetical protein I4U23_028525 [Adineta vaga]|nr:hypothetical protein I4U23_028525 [Adineta vaga]